MPRQAATAREAHGAEPELGGSVPRFDVNMRWLGSIARVEEEAGPPDPKNCRHGRSFLLRPSPYAMATSRIRLTQTADAHAVVSERRSHIRSLTIRRFSGDAQCCPLQAMVG